jgi:hypothetical protein
MANFDEPLTDLPENVRNELLQAGWVPGKNRRSEVRISQSHQSGRLLSSTIRLLKCGYWKTGYKSPYEDPFHVDKMFDLFPSALVVIDELYNLALTERKLVEFKFFGLDGFESEINRLSDLLNLNLVPIGEVPSSSIIVMSEDQHIFELSWVVTGVLYLGKGFGNVMNRMMRRMPFRPVVFTDAQDPSQWFKYDDFIPDGLEKWWGTPIYPSEHHLFQSGLR